ncbi:hypothetical protein C8R44DRAFT_725723 [Mycena epipterygia]|nr:hypothetical protein C8R44DRAFT_725723 [Mycena epipterygia]
MSLVELPLGALISACMARCRDGLRRILFQPCTLAPYYDPPSPGNGPSVVVFDCKTPGPGGVLVADILAFHDCLKHPGVHMLRQSPGPVSVTLEVRTPTFSEQLRAPTHHLLQSRLVACEVDAE